MYSSVLIAISCVFAATESFELIWNVPSQQCKQYGMRFAPLLRYYGISVNEDDTFKGEVVTIFYESQLGFYPYIGKNDSSVNSGIPQLGNITAHLKKAAIDIQRDIPNENSSGIRVIDWEAWRPTWEFNWYPMQKYQEKSKALVREDCPDAQESAVTKIAEAQFEQSAREWMLSTLNLGKEMRPNSLWGYYLFPDCYNYKGTTVQQFQCSESVRKGNDKLKWLWESSTALFPSLYVYDDQLLNLDFQQRTWFTNGRLQEALRVAHPKAYIYPYTNYSVKLGKMVPEEDFWRILSQIASLGMPGAVVWGSSASVGSKNYCTHLELYITSVLGPAFDRIRKNTGRCSAQICHSRGQCTWPQDVTVIAWRFLAEKEDHRFDKSIITCKCSQKYEGRYCEKTDMSENKK